MATKTNHGQLGLARWSIYINDGKWFPRDFDVVIIEFLQYALAGKVSKLLISEPRRHGKTTLISKNFVSYFLAHYPNDDVIISSYTQLLASNFGKDVKNILKEYGHLSPYNVELADDSRANNKFNLKHPYTGRVLAVGQAGSIIGFGAGLFIIDDPLKSPKEARSKTVTENLKEWIMGVAKTSLEFRKNGLPPIMIIIAQRLGTNDLHGIIKQNEPVISAKEALEILRAGGKIPEDTWVDLNFPAICEDPEEDLLGRAKGEALWAEQRPIEWLEAERKAMGSFLFNAIYQGNPQERDGPIFKRQWFLNEKGDILPSILIKSDSLPDNPNEMRYWDFAASGDDGDNLASIKTAFFDDKLVVRGILNGKYSASQVLNRFEATTVKDGKDCRIVVEQEPGSMSKLLIKKFRQLEILNDYPRILADKVKDSKLDRSFDLEILAENGKLLFDTDKLTEREIKMIINQLIAFTGEDGGEDDIVDTLTGSARYWKRPRRKVVV
jgi:hypothetical protein